MSEPRPRRILPIIVLAQFCGTSLWFAGNAASADLGMGDSVAYVASAVQLGFIVGTLCSAWLRIADRYAASRLFFGSCLLGAACNYPLTMLALATLPQPDAAVLILRFLVGVALAGIYPVGIRAAASWFQAGLGHALGFLTGALVLGTSFPHLMRALGARIDGGLVLASASAIAVLGGAAMLAWVPDDPYARRAPSSGGGTLAQAWRSLPGLRAAAIGYFGHMWELYAFWTFVPFYVAAHAAALGAPMAAPTVSLWAFAIIGLGALGCVGGGFVSRRLGSRPVALTQLSLSGLCCVLSPLCFALPTPAFLAFLLFWGIVVVGDSPQFAALVAQESPPAQVGSIVTLVNAIGFAITVVSIQLLDALAGALPAPYVMAVLAAGPIIGVAWAGAGGWRPAPR